LERLNIRWWVFWIFPEFVRNLKAFLWHLKVLSFKFCFFENWEFLVLKTLQITWNSGLQKIPANNILFLIVLQEENYSTDLVQVFLNKNSNISKKDAQLNGIYAMAIEVSWYFWVTKNVRFYRCAKISFKNIQEFCLYKMWRNILLL
jgi:hypothetical protein